MHNRQHRIALAVALVALSFAASSHAADGSFRQDMRKLRHSIHQGARATGHAIHQGARATGHAIHRGAKATGHAIHKGVDKITGK